jgi:hypothetical protein
MKRIADALELLTAQHEELDLQLKNIDTVAPAQRALALGSLADKLATHLAAEQQLLDVLEVKDYADDHDRVRDALAEVLAVDVESAEMPARVEALAGVLGKHTSWQEEVLFVMLAESVEPTVLEQVGALLAEWAAGSSCLSVAA